MATGDVLASERTTFRDEDTGRTVVRYTGAQANSYPLSYFIPSHSADGRYDPGADTHEEVRLPGVDYVHTGFDPEGRFLFFENLGDTHEILSAHFPRDPARFRLKRIRRLGPIPFGQRYHAHLFLSPDRQWAFFTEVLDGYSQVSAVDASDLVDLDEYW